MKKISAKVFPVLVVAILSMSSAHAKLLGLLPDGKKIDALTAMTELRDTFMSAGIALNIDTAPLKGTTDDGDICSVDLSLVAQLPDNANLVEMNLTIGDPSSDEKQESVFNLTQYDSHDPTSIDDIRQLKTAKNILSLVTSQPESSDQCQDAGKLICTSIHRRIDVTTLDGKVAAVHVKDESSEATCHLK
jgi:hypothetical protein